VRRDLLRANLAEGCPEPLFAARIGVCDELDCICVLELLEAGGQELHHHRARCLGSLGWHGGGDATEPGQRKALFSLSKNPSSGRYVSASTVRPNCSRSSRCCSV